MISLFDTKKKNSRNKLLSVRLSFDEMNALNNIVKESSDFSNKTDFIRHLILVSPEYLLYSKQKFEEATAELSNFEELLFHENYASLKPYYNKYFNLKVKTHQRYLKTLSEDERNEILNSFIEDSIHVARQSLIREARTWRNLYEESCLAFSQAQAENQDILNQIENN